MRRPAVFAALALALLAAAAPPAGGAGTASAAAHGPTLAAEATAVIREFLKDPHATIPPEFLQNAHGVAILPRLRKLSFGLTLLWGEGVLIVRGPEDWGGVFPVELEGESIGFEFLLRPADTLILVIRDAKMMKDLLAGEEGVLELGSEARVAVGPLSPAEGSPSAEGYFHFADADVFSYYRSAGIVIGVSLPTSARLKRTNGPIPVPAVAELKTHLDRYILRALMLK